ncbi:uncharacterized protein Tco025E_08443 [Trypanosoma conorhini]|uniref:Uncharacterized protein n=1 Tax=Trypanosoma conorhini TaxID=83891 RepID=A0A422N9Q9_9TRYP|nr:uncharacterized protein Tco025E_08443 [Trypanosoma conorhini]RNF02181.1 hypothetical protein Tco025E_08443 [Trypanosoma conorhini]
MCFGLRAFLTARSKCGRLRWRVGRSLVYGWAARHFIVGRAHRALLWRRSGCLPLAGQLVEGGGGRFPTAALARDDRLRLGFSLCPRALSVVQWPVFFLSLLFCFLCPFADNRASAVGAPCACVSGTAPVGLGFAAIQARAGGCR